MRRILFVGGTSFSGSTLLDMTLAHDATGFSCGELYAYLCPPTRDHVTAGCGCGDSACDVWSEVRRAPLDAPYAPLFARDESLQFVVDSSKKVSWLWHQARAARTRGERIDHVLVYKSPLEFAQSYARRGRLGRWADDWIGYHRLYTSAISRWHPIAYRDLVCTPSALEDLCRGLDLAWREDKHEYWRQRHHTLFGNAAARIHGRDPGSAAYRSDAAVLASTRGASYRDAVGTSHRTVSYRPVKDPALAARVAATVAARPEIATLLERIRAGVGIAGSPLRRLATGARLRRMHATDQLRRRRLRSAR